MRKHTNASRASVTLRYAPEALGIDGSPRRTRGRATRIIGMCERTALFHGELESGPAPGGGFRVHARLPL